MFIKEFKSWVFTFLILMAAFAFTAHDAKAVTISITPAAPINGGTCHPLAEGKVATYPAGFNYKNLPAFELQIGDTISFDMNGVNEQNIQLDIEMGATTVNGGEILSGSFTKIVSNTSPAATPKGDAIANNYELTYTVEAAFSFAGGGLIIRFTNPDATTFALDVSCGIGPTRGVNADASGYFLNMWRDGGGDGLWPYSSDNPDYAAGFVLEISDAGLISTVAGTGTDGAGADNIAATSSALKSPTGIAHDSSGNLYITDYANHSIRRVDAVSGLITTIANTAKVAGSVTGGLDAADAAVRLNNPIGIYIDSSDNIYITEANGHCVQKINASDNKINKIAGTCGSSAFSGDTLLATSAELSTPVGITMDSIGNIYIADRDNNRVRKIDVATGIINTIIGNGTGSSTGDDSDAASATVNGPEGLVFDSEGNLYISEILGNRIRRVDAATNIITTVANGANPRDLAIDLAGDLYYSQWGSHIVTKLDISTSTTSTFAGTLNSGGWSGDGSQATGAQLNDPMGLSIDSNNNVYIAQYLNSAVRKILAGTSAYDDTFMAYEDVTTTGTLHGTNGAGDPITYIKVTDPANGTVTITDSTTGAYSYTPDADFNGADSFTFKVNDGSADSADGTVTVTIRGVDEVQAEAGEFHTIVIKADGTMWASGDDTNGEQGNGAGGDNTEFTKIGTDNDWAVISAGYFYNLALKTDGTLWAWGRNFDDQLGVVCAHPCQAPVQVSTDTDWAFIDGGLNHSAAIKSDGSLWTWANDAQGQLGNGGLGDQTTPTKVSSDVWSNVSAGGLHSLAVKADGSLWAWGLDSYGQLGDGVVNPANHSITRVGVASNWTSASAGFEHSTAINSDGKIYSWGRDIEGQLGDGTIATPNANPDVAQVGSLTNWVSILTGSLNTMAINSSGELYSWGFNPNGQLGHSGTTNNATVTQVGTDTDWASISPNLRHTVGVKTDGTILIWGSDEFGQLGLVTSETCGGQPCSTTPVAPFPTAPKASDSNFYALEDVVTTGTLTGFDYNIGDSITYIKLTDPANGSVTITNSTTGAYTYTPDADFNGATSFTFKTNDGALDSAAGTVAVTIRPVNEIMAVAGETFTIVLSNGEVWGAGNNTYGALGDGTTTDRSTFTQESSGSTDWAYIAAGFFHTLAIKTDGTLWSWGYDNDFGTLGIGASPPDNCGGISCSVNPVQVGSDNDWSYIAAGNATSAAIKSDGSLYLWGYDNESVTADGSTAQTHKTVPTEIVNGGAWKSIDLSWIAAVGVKTNGTLWSWGTQSTNQLGTAAPEWCGFNWCNTSPVQLGAATNWVSADNGPGASFALNSAGEVWGWGTDNNGEQGDGTATPNVTTPTKVGSATNYTSLSAGHNIWTINSNGELYRWGDNSYGAIGDGTTTDMPTVTKYGTDTDWAYAYAGQWHTILIKNDGTMYILGANNYGQLGTTSVDDCGGTACSKTSLLVSLNTAPVTTDVEIGRAHV